jgi:uncharacterized protein (DUF362 family)
MIYKKRADHRAEASYRVAAQLLESAVPSRPVVIKPNIVEPSRPPVTTDVRVVEGIVRALRDSGIKDILVAEGSGTGDTLENFDLLGYSDLGVKLLDLDQEETVRLPVAHHHVWDEVIVPKVLLDKFIISVPVLKEHSLCGVTISLKNMIGILPAPHYSGYWTYKKSQVHKYDTHGCIADIIQVVSPDWAIVDASQGMKDHHLSGSPIEPPLNLVYGSVDPLEADRFGCELLGREQAEILYLKLIEEDKREGSQQ